MADVARVAVEHEHCDGGAAGGARGVDQEGVQGFAVRGREGEVFVGGDAEVGGAGDAGRGAGARGEVARVD